MSKQLDFGDLPPYSEPTTSLAAAVSILPHAAALRAKVFAAIDASGPDGATCDELEIRLDMSHQTCSARVNELMRRERIETRGLKRPTRSGRKAWVWFPATPKPVTP